MQTEIEILHWKQYNRPLVLHKNDLCESSEGVPYWFWNSGSITHGVRGKHEEHYQDTEPHSWCSCFEFMLHEKIKTLHKPAVCLQMIKTGKMGRNKNCASEQTKPQGAKHNVSTPFDKKKTNDNNTQQWGRMTQKWEITRGSGWAELKELWCREYFIKPSCGSIFVFNEGVTSWFVALECKSDTEK